MNKKKKILISNVNQMFEVLYGVKKVLINNHTIYTVVREIKKVMLGLEKNKVPVNCYIKSTGLTRQRISNALYSSVT